MKKLFKKFVPVLFAMALIASALSFGAFASYMGFGENTTQKHIGEFTQYSWDNPISNDVVNDKHGRSNAFYYFKYVKNESSCNGVRFILWYDRVIGVYTPDNDYDEYDVYWAATFDDDFMQRVKLGQIEVNITAKTRNAKGTFNQETGRISLKGYQSDQKSETFNFYSTGSKCDGERFVDSGWIRVPSDTEYLRINAWSDRGGLGTQKRNRSAVYDIKVLFRDTTAPKPIETGIVEGDWSGVVSGDNTADNDFKVAVPGSTIKYYVKFNETIRVDNNKLRLRIQNRGDIRYPTRPFYAEYAGCSGDTMYFTMKVTDNTDCVTASKDTSLNPTGAVYELEHSGFTDTSGNIVEGDKPLPLRTLFKPSNLRINDVKAGFAKEMNDENGYYPTKYTRVPTSGFVCGSFPKDLIGTTLKTGSGNPNLQPTVAGPDTPVYFRIAVNDEIKTLDLSSSANYSTKLKVIISKRGATPLDKMDPSKGDKFGYASLVAARIIGNNNGSGNHYGVKNNMVTEMFFKYVHDKNDTSLENTTYTVYPAFEAQSSIPSESVWVNVRGIDDDGTGFISAGEGTYIRTASNELLTDIFIERLKMGPVPKIDCSVPVLAEKKISEEWSAKLPDDNYLKFEDNYDLSSGGVTISVVQYDNSGNRIALPIIMPGSEAGYSYVLPSMYSMAKLGGLQLAAPIEDNQRPMYLEYSLKDKAGNEGNNFGEKNIRLYLDNTPPTVTYRDGNYTVDGNSATVKYDVKDIGIGEISHVVYYKVEAMGMFGNTPSIVNKTAYKYKNHGTIDFTGVQGTRELWRVWASYSDTLGNRAVDDNGETVYTPSEPIELATRTLDMSAVRNSEMVSDEHDVRIKFNNEPTTDYTIELYYKWVYGSSDVPYIKYKKMTVTDYKTELANVNFADEAIVKQFVDEAKGERTFYAYAKLLPEDVYCYNLTQTVYFDKSAPTISTTVKMSDPDKQASEIHYISYDITDDGGSYKNGIYTKHRNVSFVPEYESAGGEPVYPKLNVYIDNELIRTDELTLLTGTYVSNVKEDFLTSEFTGARTISYEIEAEDKFGHETKRKVGTYYIDAEPPELSDIEVKFKPGAFSDYDEEKDFYIINDLADIESLSTTITDNFSGNLVVSHQANGAFRHFTSLESTDEYAYTYRNPVKSDFTTTYHNGRMLYYFTFDGEDVIGNAAYTKIVYFLVDAKTPEIFGRVPQHSAIYKEGTEFVFDLEYDYESHEQFEDFTVEVEGEGAEVNHYYFGRFSVKVTQNTVLEISVTDGMGKTGRMSVNIDWYDDEAPEVSEGTTTKTPEKGEAKYGEIRFNVTDRNYVGTVLAAIVEEGTDPTEDDYFDGGITAEYFGEENEYTEVYLSRDNGRYILEFKAIPDGEYDIYAKAYDFCGNESEDTLIAQISTTMEGAQLVSGPTYTPDTLTGGEVIVNVKTDIPTARIYDIEGDGSIAAMQEAVAEARLRGFSYVLDGEYHSETEFDTINALYEELRDKGEYDLTPEEKEIYKGYNAGTSYDPYAGILDPENTYEVVEPQRDVLDFLHNEAYYPMEESYEGYDVIKTVSDGTRLVNIVESYNLDTDALAMAGITNEDEVGIEFEDAGTYTMNVLTYPTRFDESVFGEYNKALYEQYLICVNPFYGEALTQEAVYETFGEGIDLNLFTYDEETGEYFFPVDYEEVTAEEIKAAGFGEFMHLFSTGEYTNPFVEGGDILTEDELRAAVEAIGALKELRKKTATIVADRYCKLYLNNPNQSYSANHNMRFRYNTERDVRFIDRTGQEIVVPISIDWIDPSLPHVPYDDMMLELVQHFDHGYGDPYDSSYAVTGPVSLTPEPDYGVVDKKLLLTVDLTSYKENDEIEIYDQFYIVNLPEGAEAEEVFDDNYDEMPLYDKFVLEVTENGIISFDVINPSVIDDATKTYIAPQIYIVDCIDDEAPAATLEYTPAKPASDKKKVNTDVTVRVVDMVDNIAMANEVQLDFDAMLEVNGVDEFPDEFYYSGIYTFTENGEFTFVISDLVNNRTYIPAVVDYIDKNSVDIELELLFEGEEVAIEDVSGENTDPTFVEKVYKVTDDRAFGKNLEIKAYVNGEVIAQDTILVGENSWHVEYEGPSGNVGTAYISGFEFDTQPPETNVTYSVHRPGKGEKSYAVATISVYDEIVDELSIVSVRGKAGEHDYTMADADIHYPGVEGEPATVQVRFDENGYADVVIADVVGNAATVQLSVSTLDRIAPTGSVQYSTKAPTNKDVDAFFILSEPADYQIFDTNGNIIRDYAGAYTNYFSHTFTDNASVFLRFTDCDGNESESFVATVTNIDKQAPVLRVKDIHKNKAMDMEGNMITYYGAATIELEVASAGDILEGTDEDTVVIVGASQSLFHTVMENDVYTFMYSDLAGNMSKLKVDVDVIDDTLPTATVTGNPTAWTNVATEITITANPKPDGSPSYIIMNGVEYETVKFTAIENGDVGYVLKDTSNNSVTANVEVRYVDLGIPTIEYEGSKDLYVLPGDFDRDAFEDVEYYDNSNGSGITADGLVITYPADFDANVPGAYDVTFSVTDNAGNNASLVRKVTVLGEDDVYALINGTILVPDTMTTFWNGEALELSFLNAEKQGDKLSYAFEPGYFMAAEMKGTPYKKLTTPDSKIELDAEKAGIYTLFVQTEDRKMMVMYVFVAGTGSAE